MTTQDEPTPVTGVARIIANSERRDRLEALELRIEHAETRASTAEQVAREAQAVAVQARAEVGELRTELRALGGRVGVVEGLVAVVSETRLDVLGLKRHVYVAPAAATAGVGIVAAIVTAIAHALGH